MAGLRWTLFCFAVVVTSLVSAGSGMAQQPLNCGDSLPGSLSGDSDIYTLNVPAGAVGFVQATATSDGINSLRMRITGRGVDVDTCQNVATFVSGGGEQRLEVSSCFGGRGSYQVSSHVVSDHLGNCGLELACGATPDGIALNQFGEVDSFQFPGLPGERVDLSIADLEDRDVRAPYLVRVYDPRGELILDSCDETISVRTDSAAMHSVLVSACGDLSIGRYRLDRLDRRCPRGPVITTFAMLPVNRDSTLPDDYDALGRPIYRSDGVGTLIVEGRPGASLRPIGPEAFNPEGAPDFQAIVSRPLGAGDPAVCDQGAMPPGGIAPTVPFGFGDGAGPVDRTNDFGCRVNDGTGAMVGRPDPLNSCVRNSFGFEDPQTTMQFCADIPNAERFAAGDTVVSVRLRDLSGNLGEPREIIVRVGGPDVPTPTATETLRPVTPTPTRPPTPRPTQADGPCTCDCNEDCEVRVDELTRSVRIALGQASIGLCERADQSGDGMVVVAELIQGVNNALIGCPPKQ